MVAGQSVQPLLSRCTCPSAVHPPGTPCARLGAAPTIDVSRQERPGAHDQGGDGGSHGAYPMHSTYPCSSAENATQFECCMQSSLHVRTPTNSVAVVAA